jgi:hypothetical protein
MEEKDFSSDDVRALLKLLDQTAIRDVIGQYFSGLDRRDFAALTACFTSDAHGEYDGGKTVHVGREAIIKALQGITQFKFSTHLIGSMMIELNGDRAKADTHGIAFLVVDDSGGKGRILVRGLRYLDDLVQGPEGWRISHRVHIPIWQYEAASVPPALPRAK